MDVAVWDTYVKREDGKLMHFDILIPDHIQDENIILDFGRQYLAEKSFKTFNLSASECTFCHIEEAPAPIVEHIITYGYYIIEMEHCN